MNSIKELIYNIRDKQVLLDSDVAKLYGYETKVINQAVRRNKVRFPKNFCFQLTKEEYETLQLRTDKILLNNKEYLVTSNVNVMRSQNVTASSKKRNERYLPYVFTEQGIAMLSGLLKNDIAVQVSINIMNAFVDMRKFINANKNLLERVITIENTITTKFKEYDNKFDEIFDYLQNEKEFKEKIFFEGQIYDSHSLLIDIIKKSRNNITIIDNYIDDSILFLLSMKSKDVKVTIITNKKYCKLSNLKKEYPEISICYSNSFHDRFIIIDDNIIYHIGASLKDLGKKCFAISIMNDKTLLEKLNN